MRESLAVPDVVARIKLQSRVAIGALVSIGAGAGGLFNVVVSPEDAETNNCGHRGGAVICGGVTLYPLGRQEASR